MDLIYTDKDHVDVGVMPPFTFDLAYGSDENDFELAISSDDHCCEAGCLAYIEGTEYGGIIDDLKVDTGNKEITYTGRTWHGILASKILEPDAGEDYLTVTGEANSVVASLVSRMELTDLFDVSAENSGLHISSYKMNRYIDGYQGIRKMLATVSGKLLFRWHSGKVVLSVVPAKDYSDELDSDKVDMLIRKKYSPVNHLICLGKGELAERTVINLYADAAGNISEVQTFAGMKERTDVYDNSAAESDEDLREKGKERFRELLAEGSVEIALDDESDIYDIDDIVGSTEQITGIRVTAKIVKKIISIRNNQISIEHKLGV